MATIARTTKAGSGTGDFAAGTTIVAAEMNADLNAIYNEFNGSIAAANLAANAVTTTKILDANVTLAKLAVNASQRLYVAVALATGLAIDTTETTLATSGAQTFSGGRVMILTAAGGNYENVGSGSTHTITLRWKIDGVAALTIALEAFFNEITGIAYPMTIPTVFIAPTAGSHTVLLTAQTDDVALIVKTPAANPGYMFLVEVA